MTFSEGGTSLGTVTLDATGTATLPSFPFTAGTHILLAAYPGTATLAPSSASLTLTLSVGDFSLQISPTTLATTTLAQPAMATVTLTPIAGLTGPVNLRCLNLPAGNTCTFANQEPSLTSAAPTQTTLTILTNLDQIASRRSAAVHPSRRPPLLPLLALPLLGILPLGRHRRSHPHVLPRLLLLLLVAALAAPLGCGILFFRTPRTTSFQVVATSAIASSTHTVDVTLTY